MQRIDVLEDIGRLVGDEEDVEIFERLVDITDFGSFYGGMLAVGGNEFRERCEEGFDSGPRHRVELTRKHGCTQKLSVVAKNASNRTFSALGTYRGCQNDLYTSQ